MLNCRALQCICDIGAFHIGTTLHTISRDAAEDVEGGCAVCRLHHGYITCGACRWQFARWLAHKLLAHAALARCNEHGGWHAQRLLDAARAARSARRMIVMQWVSGEADSRRVTRDGGSALWLCFG